MPKRDPNLLAKRDLHIFMRCQELEQSGEYPTNKRKALWNQLMNEFYLSPWELRNIVREQRAHLNEEQLVMF